MLIVYETNVKWDYSRKHEHRHVHTHTYTYERARTQYFNVDLSILYNNEIYFSQKIYTENH